MLRWNPLLRTWTMVAANRQNRPNMPKDWCPFCPGSGKVPEQYDVFCYPNDFPVLSRAVKADVPNEIELPLYAEMPPHGQCDVILYSPDHHASLYQLSGQHLLKLIHLWQERHRLMEQSEDIKYVFVFENRGEAVGVTMPHPHGQIYGYPFVPLKLKVELESSQAYYSAHGRNLFEDMNREEQADGRRMIHENQSFLAYIPHFTDYPYGVFVVAKDPILLITDFNEQQEQDLAEMLRAVTGGMDMLFEERFPYMMCMHQAPLNSAEYGDLKSYFRFHIEFYTPWRAKGVIKYYASSESGAWAAANTRQVEDTAPELRAAVVRFLEAYTNQTTSSHEKSSS